MKEKCFSIKKALTILMLGIPAVMTAANDGVVFDLDGFVATDTDGSTVYSNEKNGSNDDCFIYLNGEIANYNSISFDVKWTDVTGSYGKVALQMVDEGGGTMCFELYNGWGGGNTVAIVRYPGVESERLTRVEMPWLQDGDWAHCVVSMDSKYIYFEVNNHIIYNVKHAYTRTLWQAGNRTYLYTIGEKSQYKNLMLSNEANIPHEGLDVVTFTQSGFSTTTLDDGTTQYSNTSNGSNDDCFIYMNGDIAEYNFLDFEVQWTAPTGDYGKVCLQMTDGNGGTLCFEIYNGYSEGYPIAIVRYPGYESGNLARVEMQEISAGDWVHVQVGINGKHIYFVANDKVVYYAPHTYSSTFWQANNRTYLYTIGEKSQYRHIQLANVSDLSDAVKTVDVTIGETGYATFYYGDRAYRVPDGVGAATYAYNKEEGLYMPSSELTVVAANQGVVLEASPGTYQFTSTLMTAADRDEDSMLFGSDEAAITIGDGKKFYRLSLNAEETEGSIGFYWGAEDGAAFTNTAHKAYLAIPEELLTADAKVFLLNGTSDISKTLRLGKEGSTTFYNLQGQRINNDRHGIVIVKGKKVIK